MSSAAEAVRAKGASPREAKIVFGRVAMTAGAILLAAHAGEDAPAQTICVGLRADRTTEVGAAAGSFFQAGRGCARKNRSISALASAPAGLV